MRLSLHVGLLAVIVFITLLYAITTKSSINKKWCIRCVTVVLTLFSGLRSWRMGDVYHYCYLFMSYKNTGWSLDFETHDSIGIQLLFQIMERLHISFNGCLFIIAAFSAVTLGVLVYKYSPSPFMSYFLYICLGNYIFTLSVLKQTIAMGFIILAMIAIVDGKPLRFLTLVGIGALFHPPALIFIVAYWLARRRIDARYFMLLIIAAVLIWAFKDNIVSIMAELYYSGETEYVATESFSGKLIMMLVILAGAALIRPLKLGEPLYLYIFNIMVYAAMIQSFSIYDNVFTRLADYYFQFFVIFVPLVFNPETMRISTINGRQIQYGYRLSPSTRVLATIFITGFGLWFYRNTLNGSIALLSEFRFIWEG